MRTLHLAYTDEANDLLARDPLALLIGMLLDQQVPMEKAFTSPQVLSERMGVDRLDAAQIAAAEPEQFEELFRRVPALHRFPAAMAKRVQGLCQGLVEQYDGDAQALWSTASSGKELVARLGKLPGFGAAKARMFGALLGKQLGIQPEGWREATSPFGDDGTFQSVADVVDDTSLQKVRAYKKEMKAAAKASSAG